jgi:Tol biopolymer transport system component
VPLTSYSGNELEPSFSPDGNQVAFVWDGDGQGNARIYVKLIGSERPLRLTNSGADDISPAWSPDGRLIAFVRIQKAGQARAGIYVVPAIGGPEELVVELNCMPKLGIEPSYIAEVPHPFLAWAEGGKSLLFSDRKAPDQPSEIFVISLDSGQRRRLTSPPPGLFGDSAPAISPDGRTLVFGRAVYMTSSDLYRLPVTKDLRPMGPPERLTSTKEWTATPVWIPAAGEILFSTGGKFSGPFHLWRMSVQTGARPRPLSAYGEAGWPAYSPARGRFVFSRSVTDSNIWRVSLLDPARAGVPAKLIASTWEDNVPQYSPDGSKIVFISNRTGQYEVWVCDRDGTNAVQLTSLHAGTTGSPHWSPDGTRIVFDSTAEGRFQVYTINAAGGPPRRLTSDPSDNAVASYSHDGRFIYFSSNRTGPWQIWRMPAEGGDSIQITRQGGRGPLESPDRKFLYYGRSQPWGLWKCPVEGGPETLVAPSVSFLNYAVTQKGVYFIPAADPGSTTPVQFLGFSASVPKTVFAIGKPVTTGLGVSPDGKFLLYSQIDQKGSDLMLVENFH